jgi:hypothetical protein
MEENGKKTPANFAVLNIRKIKTVGGSVNVAAHNLRQKINNSLNEFINPALNIFNRYEGVKDYKEFNENYNEIIKKANLKRKIQRNASHIIEFVFSFSHEYSTGWQDNKGLKEKIDNYFADCKKFINNKYGNVSVSAAIHFDETTPHLHIMCIPFIYSKDGKEVKFSSSEFLGGIKGLHNLHTEFNKQVGEKYGLTRGIEGSRAKHTDLKQFKTQQENYLLETERMKNEMESKLKKIDEKEKKLEKTIEDTEYIKNYSFRKSGNLLEREAEFSKREQKLLAIENDVPTKAPEIPIPPYQLSENSRKSWRDNIQKMVNVPFNALLKAYQYYKYIKDQLEKEIKKLTKDRENLIKLVEKAEKDLVEKPIEVIIADREKRRMVNQNRNNPIQHGNKPNQQRGFSH